MALVKELTKLTVKDLWREVKDEEEWWPRAEPATGRCLGYQLRLYRRLPARSPEAEDVLRRVGHAS